MKNIITVYTGDKYNINYVNKMYHMIKRNLPCEHIFYCITDKEVGLNENIKIIQIPHDIGLEGWWIKPYMFKTGLFNQGTNLYIDLDMVIISDISKLFEYMPGRFLGARDYIYNLPNHVDKVNLASGLLRWENNTYNMIWERLDRDRSLRHSFPGDQEYLYHYHKDHISFFPESYSISYKWHYLKRGLEHDTMILDFHGHPKPHEVFDEEIIRKHWNA